MEMEFNSGSDQGSESEGEDSTMDDNEINELFSVCPRVHQVSVGPNYILHLTGSSQRNFHVAAALSNCVFNVYTANESEITLQAKFQEHKEKIVDCKFNHENDFLLYSGSNDGSIKLWDLRDPNQVAVNFLDTSLSDNSPVKPISCFDVCPNNRLLAAGTDLSGGDAYILFWDIRNTKLLGAYWESHDDDITQVKFHPEDSNKLISGSTDGLINIYDLVQSREEDALQDSLNTEALVESLMWFNLNKKYEISCTTSTSDIQLWNLDDAEPYKILTRYDLGKQLRIEEDIYIANIFETKSSLMAIGGPSRSNGGKLRSLLLNNKEIRCAFQFRDCQQLVRAAWYDKNTNILITGGEKGQIDLWRPDVSEFNFKTEKRK